MEEPKQIPRKEDPEYKKQLELERKQDLARKKLEEKLSAEKQILESEKIIEWVDPAAQNRILVELTREHKEKRTVIKRFWINKAQRWFFYTNKNVMHPLIYFVDLKNVFWEKIGTKKVRNLETRQLEIKNVFRPKLMYDVFYSEPLTMGPDGKPKLIANDTLESIIASEMYWDEVLAHSILPFELERSTLIAMLIIAVVGAFIGLAIQAVNPFFPSIITHWLPNFPKG